jgi:hypothetical protein
MGNHSVKELPLAFSETNLNNLKNVDSMNYIYG